MVRMKYATFFNRIVEESEHHFVDVSVIIRHSDNYREMKNVQLELEFEATPKY